MRLATTTRGDGPRHVALVHGLGGDGASWHDLAELLLAPGDVTLTTVDLRGHGDSPRADSYRVADFAADLVETLPRGLDAIVSHSLGGVVTAEAAAALAPRRLVHLDPGFRLAIPTTGAAGWAVRRVPGVLPLLLVIRGRGVRPPALTPENQVRADAARARWDTTMALGVFASVAAWTRPPLPEGVGGAVLLSEDARFVVPDPLPAELAAEGFTVRRVPGLGHSLFLEDAQRVHDALAELI